MTTSLGTWGIWQLLLVWQLGLVGSAALGIEVAAAAGAVPSVLLTTDDCDSPAWIWNLMRFLFVASAWFGTSGGSVVLFLLRLL